MLEFSKCKSRFGAMGLSEVLLRFLTDEELDLLETIAARPSGSISEMEQAGRIIWIAQNRAEMRHPGHE